LDDCISHSFFDEVRKNQKQDDSKIQAINLEFENMELDFDNLREMIELEIKQYSN